MSAQAFRSSHAVPGSSDAVPGSSDAVPGSSHAVPGSSHAAPGFARERVVHGLAVRMLTVRRVAPVTGNYRRITLAGPELQALRSLGPTDHVKVFVPAPDVDLLSGAGALPGAETFPDGPLHPAGRTPDAAVDLGTPPDSAPGRGTPPVPGLHATRPVPGGPEPARPTTRVPRRLHLVTPLDVGAPSPTSPAGPRPGTLRRDYTIRALRPQDGEMDIDVELHAGRGPAAHWAARLVPGEQVAVGGPRSSKLVPTDAAEALLVADGTSLPAVARWLELLPAGVPVHVVAAVDPRIGRAYLGVDAMTGARPVRLSWCPPVEAGGDPVLEVLRRTPIGPGTFVWMAGEAGGLVAARRHVRDGLGLPRGQWEISGYWRRGQGDYDHHAPLDPAEGV